MFKYFFLEKNHHLSEDFKIILQNPLISDHSFVIAWVGDRNVQSDAKTFYQILILKILDLKRKTPIDVEHCSYTSSGCVEFII